MTQNPMDEVRETWDCIREEMASGDPAAAARELRSRLLDYAPAPPELQEAVGLFLREQGIEAKQLADPTLSNPRYEVDAVLAELAQKAQIDRTIPASEGASYKPESERDTLDWKAGQYLSAQGLSDALSRGQILSAPVKAPDPLKRFLTARAEKKHAQAVEQTVKMLATDEAPEPIGLQRKREGEAYRQTLGANSEGRKPSRW